MNKRIISLLATAVLLMMIFGFTACMGGSGGETTGVTETTAGTTAWSAEKEWSYIAKKGAVTVGYIPSAPMNYTDKKGALMGFDTETARIVCAELGLNAVFMEVDEDSALKLLSEKKIDCIWGGFTASGKAAENLALTKGYMVNWPVVVASKAGADKFTSLASLKNAALTAAEGSEGETLVKAKKLSADYTPSTSEKDALQRVLDGKADAAVVGSVMANWLINTDKAFTGLAILDGNGITLGDGTYNAVAFRKSGASEVEKVNAALDKLADEGVLSDLAEKYGLSDCLALS